MPLHSRRLFRLAATTRSVERDVDAELAFHVQERTDALVARGASVETARAQALSELGDLRSARAELAAIDRARLGRAGRREWWDATWLDARFALRSLRRQPGFLIAALLTLALGIGANAAIFSVVNAVLLRPLPYADPAHLVSVTGGTQAQFAAVHELEHTFDDVATYGLASYALTGHGEPERVDGVRASANLFALLGVGAAAGRTFAPDEDQAGSDHVVVISAGIWRRKYGSDPDIIGRSLLLDGVARTVVGVMRPEFHFPSAATQLWIPMVLDRGNPGAFWGAGGNRMVARLRPGVTEDEARADVRRRYRQLRYENPVWDPGPTYGADAAVVPLQAKMVGSVQSLLLVLLGVVALVLLIACANVANLLLVRATTRRKELAIRAALGGGRARLVRQLLTESLILAALGGTLGVALAAAGVRALLALLPPGVPRVAEIAVDGRVLAFTAALTLATGLAFGLVPALGITSGGLRGALGDEGRSVSRGTAYQRLSRALVAAEIALAVMLVCGAGLLARSLYALRQIDPGFRATRVIVARVSPSDAAWTDAAAARRKVFYTEVLRRAAARPGVESVAATSVLPLHGIAYGMAIRVAGQFEDIKHDLPVIDHYQIITAGYLRTMGIRLLAGRAFADADRAGTPDVALVSESVARHFWPGQSAIGQRIGYPWPSDWVTVVGVVADVKQDSLSGTSEGSLYRPFLQAPVGKMTIVARTTANPLAGAAGLRAAVAAVDPNVPVSNVQTMSDVISTSLARPRFATLLFALFATLALVLGAVGIYGVMAYAVGQRTREIGVRMALGARSGDVLRMVLRQSVMLAFVGVALGVAGALAAGRVLAGLLYGVGPADPVVLLSVPALLGSVSLLAGVVPARRAARVDPATAMRVE